MSVYKRGGTWWYNFRVHGQRYRGSTKETSKLRAEKIEAAKMAHAVEGGNIRTNRVPLLRDFGVRFLEWVEEGGDLEPKSKLYYKNGWRLIEKTRLAGMRLNHITADDVRATQFHDSAASVNNARRTIGRMLSKAAEWKVIGQALKLTMRKEIGRSRIFDAALEAAALEAAPVTVHDVVITTLDTSLRPCEVFRMRIEKVDLFHATYFNDHGKSVKSRRFVPLTERVCEVLKRRIGDRKAGWVFLSKRSKSGHLTTINKQFSRLRERLGMPDDLVPYSARHTFATTAMRGTGNLPAVMEVMGHSKVPQNLIYQHQGIEQVRQALNKKNGHSFGHSGHFDS